ncbi:MAG: chromosome segregation protein SMC [Thermodesulfobacteriota bacterium]|nr:chromosome segregation protein SMC [Thermodesulfobacteriota bacterium]
MKIKQLEIVGFKSFPDSLKVQFPEGICAVVGPNGCGKSNIVDALRWVMGEQSVKQLRGKSMEDIIFSGSEGKGPVNLAEVAVTLINDNGNAPEEYRHFSEIMVSRRLFRSGESGYFINKQPCRLKDIQNLLMGTGVGSRTYAVVEQGKIASIIDAGPDELRFFIEEAAGITRYKSRKKEALLKIQRTQHNLLRINDVITEVKRQMNSLKRQAKKAERYKTYQARIEELEISLATHQFRTISAEMVETETLLESLRDTDFKHESELAKLDAAIEQVKQERTAKYRRISEEKAQSHDLQRVIDRLEGDIQYSTKDLERLDGDIDAFKTEAEEIEQKNREIVEESSSLEERKGRLLLDIQKIKETLGQEVGVEEAMRQRLEGLNKDLETKKGELVNLASRKATYENALSNASKQRSNLSRRLDQLKMERAETEKELIRLNTEVGKTQNHHGALKKGLDDIGAALASSEKSLQENRKALSEQVRKVQMAEVERQKARSHYGALRKMDESYEWFRKGVRVVMRQWKSQKLEESGIRGLVADVIEPEPSYEEAAEAALGETLQYIIVEDQEGGMTAIDFLRGGSGGRAGFIPMGAIRPLADSAPDAQPGGHDLLVDHIKIQKGYEHLAQSLIGHVIVADNLEAALQLWNKNGSRQAIVTRQGDRVCLQGILTGGSGGNGDSGILAKKKEVKELAAQIAKLDKAVEVAEDRQRELEKEAVALETEVQKARQAQAEKTRQQLELEKELYRLQESVRHARRHLEVLHLEAQQIAGEQTDVEQELSKHQDVLAELVREIQAHESTIEQLNVNIREVLEKAEAANQKVVELKLQGTSLQAEYDSSENTLRRLTEFQRDRQERLAQLKRGLYETEEDKGATEQRLVRDRAKMADLYAELKAMEEKLAQREGEYQTIEGKLQQNDQALCEVRTRRQESLQKMQQVELKQSERRMRRDHLVTWIQERYHQNIQGLAEEHRAEDFSEEETENALAAYRQRIAKIGDVNLTAIQEYETLSERYRLLTEQCDDLEGAIETLHRVIRRINRVSLKQFMRTFKAVNEKVQGVFPRLFEGGTANLVLTNPRRPLESGVSFLVRPPGKKLTRMSLLSGGEKALSAITLIFSLFLIKPTAFCVLDEIDAPLDEINVTRFNYLLQEIGKESQVIMVTHNRQSMEMADELLGITMEEKGVSKLVSLNLARDETGCQRSQEKVAQAS